MGKRHNDLEWTSESVRTGGKKGAWTRKKLRRQRLERAKAKGHAPRNPMARKVAKEAARQKSADATVRRMTRA